MTTNNKQAIATIRKHTIHYSEKNEKKKQKAVETVKIKKKHENSVYEIREKTTLTTTIHTYESIWKIIFHTRLTRMKRALYIMNEQKL